MKNHYLLFIFIFFSATLVAQTPLRTTNPALVKLVTDDIPRFWVAFDSCKQDTVDRTAILTHLYLDKGTPGLKNFNQISINGAQKMAHSLQKYQLYYQSIRANTFKVKTLEPQIRKSLFKLKQIYPEAQFPDIYFLIGNLNSGGKSDTTGLLIGTEIMAADSNSNFENMSLPFQKVLVSFGLRSIPLIVAHELIHYQQIYLNSDLNLLGSAIKEGSADFIGELISGENTNKIPFIYGEQHQKELWLQFKKEMNGSDISNWLYDKATVDRPKDLGYYMGYKITQAYYAKNKNKKQAIYDILHITDFNLFLVQSGYGDRFN
ncbi:DUF2268 domain-containing putative Zn-dependent protease [Mucilaginibacter sp. L196]|uniref:DUF2268 domain-containing putative Zn-dependent protease n=1 Tax=Mucilaginibacter sp. L196 TaxID=1641870 RepID=UPI00131BF057|nr:DUF2268 domain-containing putative Zn-dependent protease [Mucilaginibacter sp. L196]